ncbi:hypothetical protein ACP3TJ_03455 [Desulforudis sp. 1088]|uniref:hypothetical protein n=1 Tax=unclassified Candidatus Desulforudis TaxID=2635950 RepID=UPI003BC4B90B
MSVLRYLLVPVMVLALVTGAWAPQAVAAGDRGRVVMVVLDRATLEDYKQLHTLQEIPASWGLLNTNTGGIRNVENTHATIGASSRIIATEGGFKAYNALEPWGDEPALEGFKRLTGFEAKATNVVHLGIARIIRETENLRYDALPGALGSVLHQNGLTTCVIGNADWNGVYRRHAVTLAMDSRGIVDCGDVSRKMLLFDSSFPGAYRTNYDVIFDSFRKFADSSLVVIETGDLSRLDEARKDVLPSVLEQQKKAALERVDGLLAAIYKELKPDRDLLIVVTPTPSTEAIIDDKTLTQVVIAGSGFGEGLLTSPATRREGVVQNIDLAPTVLAHLGLNPSREMHGRAMSSIGQPDALERLEQLNHQIVLNHQIRVPMIKTYMVLQIIIVSLFILSILARGLRIADRFFLRPVLLAIMAFPVSVLLTAAFPYRSAGSLITILVLAMAVIAGTTILLGQRNPIKAFLFISLLTAGVIIGDLFSGSVLQKFAILSYDPSGGARYYGLGNEYMGILTGSTILAAASFLSLSRHRPGGLLLVALFFALTLFANAHPGLGANWGGTITAAIAFLVTLLLFLGVRFTARIVLGGLAVLLILLTATAVFDASRPAEQQSHIGRAARLAFEGGIAEVFRQGSDLVARKVSMNYKLFRYTIWSRVFLASLAAFVFLFFRPLGRMQDLQRNHPLLFKGSVGIVLGSIVALVANDSGIVAAATTMIFGAPPLLYYFLEDEDG